MPETKVCAVCGKPEDAVIEDGIAAPQHDRAYHALCWYGDPPEGHHPFIEAHCANCGRSYAEMEDWITKAGWASVDPLTPCTDQTAHRHSIWLDGHDQVRFFLAIEDRIKAAYAKAEPEPLCDDCGELHHYGVRCDYMFKPEPKLPPPCACGFPTQVVMGAKDDPVCVHQAGLLDDFVRRWNEAQVGVLSAEEIEAGSCRSDPDGVPKTAEPSATDLLEALIAKVDSLSAILTEALRARYYVAPPPAETTPYGPWQPWYPSTAKPFGWPEPGNICSSVPK